MTKLTDETLMLYADGLLEPSESARIAKIAAHDSQVRARLEVFRMTGGNLANLFDDYMRTPAPAPPWSIALPPESKATARHRQTAWWRQAPSLLFQQRQFSATGSLLAASLALICGIGLGWLLRAETGGRINTQGDLVKSHEGRLVAEGALRRALETMPSGQRISASQRGEHGQIGIRMTFQNESGDHCREYEVGFVRTRHVGVACRAGGSWIVSYQALLPSAPSADRGVVPAASPRAAMDAAVGALISGDPLSVEGEATLLDKHWAK
jgi:surface antigen